MSLPQMASYQSTERSPLIAHPPKNKHQSAKDILKASLPRLKTDFESIQPPCLYIPIPPQADLEACRVSRQEANRGPSRAPPRRRASSVLEGIATFLSATLLLAILVSLVWFDDRKVFLTVFGAFAAIGLYTTLVYFACEFMDRWVAKCREADPLDSGIV